MEKGGITGEVFGVQSVVLWLVFCPIGKQRWTIKYDMRALLSFLSCAVQMFPKLHPWNFIPASQFTCQKFMESDLNFRYLPSKPAIQLPYACIYLYSEKKAVVMCYLVF